MFSDFQVPQGLRLLPKVFSGARPREQAEPEAKPFKLNRFVGLSVLLGHEQVASVGFGRPDHLDDDDNRDSGQHRGDTRTSALRRRRGRRMTSVAERPASSLVRHLHRRPARATRLHLHDFYHFDTASDLYLKTFTSNITLFCLNAFVFS